MNLEQPLKAAGTVLGLCAAFQGCSLPVPPQAGQHEPATAEAEVGTDHRFSHEHQHGVESESQQDSHEPNHESSSELPGLAAADLVYPLTLEERLRRVVSAAAVRLREQELRPEAWQSLIYSTAFEVGIFSEPEGLVSYELGQLQQIVEEQLGVDSREGLRSEYLAAACTPLSQDAKQDVSDYQLFELSLNEYLEATLPDSGVNQRSLEALVREYVRLNLPDTFRRRKIEEQLLEHSREQFEAAPSSPWDKIGDFSRSDLSAALQNGD